MRIHFFDVSGWVECGWVEWGRVRLGGLVCWFRTLAHIGWAQIKSRLLALFYKFSQSKFIFMFTRDSLS